MYTRKQAFTTFLTRRGKERQNNNKLKMKTITYSRFYNIQIFITIII